MQEKIEILSDILSRSKDLGFKTFVKPQNDERVNIKLDEDFNALRTQVQKLSILEPELYEHADFVVKKCGKLINDRRRSENPLQQHDNEIDMTPTFIEFTHSLNSARSAFQAYVSHKPIPTIIGV